MVKQKISITIEEQMVNILENMLEGELFRNRSHIVEFALNKLIQDTKTQKKEY